MNDERKDNQGDSVDDERNDMVDVTVQWYKANVVRLVFNDRVIWETKDIALDDIIDPDTAFSETTIRLGLLEASNYTQILYRGLQVGRLEQVNLLVQLRVEQWRLKIMLFEQQLKQRMVDMGFAKLIKDVNPNDPDSYTLDDEPASYVEGECNGMCCDCEDCVSEGDECNSDCAGCDGSCCAYTGVDDIESDDDTLRPCKGCNAYRDSCASCGDADPDDRYMNDGDIKDADANARRVGGEKSDGTGLADNDDIYRRD
jgi:hypothetical protein